VRPANRPRPKANPASQVGAPAKVESRALFVPLNICSGQAIALGEGGVPSFVVRGRPKNQRVLAAVEESAQKGKWVKL
jgi:hypothetical protein